MSDLPASDARPAIAITLEGFDAPPHSVPLLVVDLGTSIGQAACSPSDLELASVHSFDNEVYPASRRWTYSYLMGSSPLSGSLRLCLDEDLIYSSSLQVSEQWAELERLFEAVPMVIGGIDFRGLELNANAQIEQLNNRLADGALVGATIARHPDHRGKPTFIPCDWSD